MNRTLREYYNKQIINYLFAKKITFQHHRSKHSDYYYIQNIKGRDGHTLKIRISNHAPTTDYEIPFLQFDTKAFPASGVRGIRQRIGKYIAIYKEKIS
jgi:hypothetical protein